MPSKPWSVCQLNLNSLMTLGTRRISPSTLKRPETFRYVTLTVLKLDTTWSFLYMIDHVVKIENLAHLFDHWRSWLLNSQTTAHGNYPVITLYSPSLTNESLLSFLTLRGTVKNVYV